MPYYDKTIFIPHVDRNDELLGTVERWEAHEKGILHRAFTVGLLYEDQLICQHRKHPVFDKWFDLTASSHPQAYQDGTVQTNEEAIYLTLEREWNIPAEQVKGLHSRGHVVYEARDPNSIYKEHEFCYLFMAIIDRLPVVNHEVSYGYTLQSISDLKQENSPFKPALAAWVNEFLHAQLL